MKQTTRTKVWIPELSESRIRELAERIKPVVQFPRKGLCFIKPVDPITAVITWNPRAADKAKDLKPLCDIRTYHSFEHEDVFKPSTAEVLAQIPAKYLDKVVAFEIIEKPGATDDFNQELEARRAGFHSAKIRLYVRE